MQYFRIAVIALVLQMFSAATASALPARGSASSKVVVAPSDESTKAALDDVVLWNGRARVLELQGDRLVEASQYKEALTCYEAGTTTCEITIRSASQPSSLYIKALLLNDIGYTFWKMHRSTDALRSYSDSVRTLNEVLVRIPNYRYACFNKGCALTDRGKLLAKMSKHKLAIASYEEAIAAYSQAIEQKPNDGDTYFQKARALLARASEQMTLTDKKAARQSLEEAVSSYQGAIKAYDEAIASQPTDMRAYGGKASVLAYLGDLEKRLGRYHSSSRTGHDN